MVYVGKIDIEQARELAVAQGVSSIPDVRIYKDGQRVDQFLGFPGEDAVLEKISILSRGITAEIPATAQSTDSSVRPLDKNEMPKGMQKRGL
ncbi:MAG: thioredoxin family protein [Akkermansiaceae bacterium]|nr:thioredoxin family protein [Akkermansiaceae bacterium]